MDQHLGAGPLFSPELFYIQKIFNGQSSVSKIIASPVREFHMVAGADLLIGHESKTAAIVSLIVNIVVLLPY